MKWNLVLHSFLLPFLLLFALLLSCLSAAGKVGTPMKNPNAFSHLTLEERRIILTGISNGSTKSAIAQTIGKDKSTVGKEIKAHRKLTHKYTLPLEYSSYRKCPFKRQCTPGCPEYIPFRCSRRDRSSCACNGCSNWSYCRFNKYQYCPEDAHNDYLTPLTDSRQGVNLTASQARSMAETISPLLKQGQSPYHIIASHPELGICEKTLYNYIESGIFQQVSDISVMDLKRQVSRKLPKKKSHTFKKRDNRKYLQGRLLKTTGLIFMSIRRSLSPRWTPSITMALTALLSRPFSLSAQASSSPSSTKKKQLFP